MPVGSPALLPAFDAAPAFQRFALGLGPGVAPENSWLWSGLPLAVFVLGLALLSLWYRSLRKEIRRRKTTEAALTDSVLRYCHLVQAIPHGIIEINRDLQVTYCNLPLARMLGYELRELTGRPLADLVADDMVLTEIRARLGQGGGYINRPLQLRDKLQRLFDVQFALDLVDPQKKEDQVIIVTDLTRQQQAERALRESEAFYRNTFDNIRAGVVHLGGEGAILRVNRFMCEMLGYSEVEFSRLTFVQITHAEDRSISEELLQQLQSGECGHYSLAKRYLKKSGEPVWAMVTVSRQQQPGGEAGYVVVVQDIDEFKHQQDEVAETSQNLEAIIEKRTTELQQRVDEVEKLNLAMTSLADDLQYSNIELAQQRKNLKAANAELEAFAYSVSHDLRAPLRHISGFVAMLQEQATCQLDAGARAQLDKIAVSAEKMGKMIDDLLLFSRAGRTELLMTPVDMDLLVREVRAEIDENYPQLAIEWRVEPLPQVRGDVSALRQVVVNLLDNAAKYSSNNTHPRITVNATRTADEVIIAIRDNGVGFDPQYADRLYKVFQRLHREDEFSGTGIGLATVRRIIGRHGGWVKGESQPGAGACFSFVLKAHDGGAS